MAFDPRNNRADQPARLAHLDNGNQRAILVEGGEGPAQIIGLRHWRAPSLSFPATMVPPPRRPAHSIYPLFALFYQVEIRHRQLPSMTISHPLTGADARENMMRLW